MSGFDVKQALPHPEAEQSSPFILLHYAKNTLIGGERPEELGVPPHPHCGFSPVSIIYDGAVHHRDSMGNSSIINKGGIQWLNAGKGMIHSERPTKKAAADGGKQELIQLWINTPKSNKKDAPEYYPFEENELPKISKGNGYLSLIAGEYEGEQSPVKTHTNLILLNGNFIENDELEMEFNDNYNVSIFILNGELDIDSQRFTDEEMILDLPNKFSLKAHKNTRALIMAGEPINEPMVSYGPFIVNYEAEIKQAMLDYQSGKFGELKEVFE